MPRRGPLLLVSNHPGLADAVALFAATPRDDMRMIAADRPFLDALPNTSRYLLTIAETSAGRSGSCGRRPGILQGGGAVLTFPGGRIESDPVVSPRAVEALDLVIERRLLRPPHSRNRGRPRSGQRCDLTFGLAKPLIHLRRRDATASGSQPRSSCSYRSCAMYGSSSEVPSMPNRGPPSARRLSRSAAADGDQGDGVTSDVQHSRSPLVFLFITVFVDMIGYGIVVPLLPSTQSCTLRRISCRPACFSLRRDAVRRRSFPRRALGPPREAPGPPALPARASLAYLLLGLAQTLVSLVVAVVLAGAASGTLATAQAYIADSTTKRTGRGLGLIGAAFGLGLMAGPALGGLLSLHSLGAPALFASALALTNCAFGYLTLPESHAPHLRKKVSLLTLDPISQLARILRMRHIRALLAAVLLLNLALAGLVSNFPLFSQVRFGWGTTSNAFFFAFVGVCAVVTQGFLIGRLQPRFGESRLLLGGLALAS